MWKTSPLVKKRLLDSGFKRGTLKYMNSSISTLQRKYFNFMEIISKNRAHIIGPTIFVLLLLVFIGAGNFFSGMWRNSPYKNRLIVKDVPITAEWQEFDAKGKIESIGDANYISIDLESPFAMGYQDNKITAPGVEGFHPEIKIVDESGKEYLCPLAGSLGKSHILYSHAHKLPGKTNYTKLLIRSDVPFKARNIFFTYYYARDLP